MKIFEQISDVWLGIIWLKAFDYYKGMEWNLAPYWGWDYILFSLWTIFTGSSGMLIIDEKGFIEILSMAAILWILLDFLILSRISSKNTQFLQDNPEKLPKNIIFIIFFTFWRIFLPDIFIVSSLSAHYFRMNLNKKQIFLISLCAQSVRILILAIIYFGISINF